MATGGKAILSFQEWKRKAYAQFETHLEKLGLGQKQIEEQKLPELEKSLKHVDEAIKNSSSFGVFNLKMTPDKGLVKTENTEYQYEIDILPLLYERKKLILARLIKLKAERQVESIRDLAVEISEAGEREKIKSTLEEMNTSEALVRQTHDVELVLLTAEQRDQRAQERFLKLQTEMKLQMEMKERKARIWQGFLQKESVATIVGGFLLLVLTICLIVDMFLRRQITEVLKDAFLIILGYFFGQTAIRREAKFEKETSKDS